MEQATLDDLPSDAAELYVEFVLGGANFVRIIEITNGASTLDVLQLLKSRGPHWDFFSPAEKSGIIQRDDGSIVGRWMNKGKRRKPKSSDEQVRSISITYARVEAKPGEQMDREWGFRPGIKMGI